MKKSIYIINREELITREKVNECEYLIVVKILIDYK